MWPTGRLGRGDGSLPGGEGIFIHSNPNSGLTWDGVQLSTIFIPSTDGTPLPPLQISVRGFGPEIPSRSRGRPGDLGSGQRVAPTPTFIFAQVHGARARGSRSGV